MSSIRGLSVALLVPVISIGGTFAMAKALQWEWGDVPALSLKPAPPRVQNSTPPGVNRTSNGRALFVQNCAHCHGNDASGDGEDGDGPDLHDLRLSDARIKAVILRGIKGEMPSFAKKLPDPSAADLIEYLRTLQPASR